MLTVEWRNPLNHVDVNNDRFVTAIDALIVINELNSFGARDLGASRPADANYLSTTGDTFVSALDALLVINALNQSHSQPILLREGLGVSVERLVTITLGQELGSRIYQLEVQAEFDRSDSASLLGDFFAVYLTSGQSENHDATLLDRGTVGTSLFAMTESSVEIAPGIVTWDGSILQIDLTTASGTETGQLEFQLINGDSDRGSTVKVSLLSNEVLPDLVASGLVPGTAESVNAGPSTDLSQLNPSDGLDLELTNPRYESSSSVFQVDLRLTNDASSIGRLAVVVFPTLPAGVVLQNASGLTSDNKPYINFQPAIVSGGLHHGDKSRTVTARFSNPNRLPLALNASLLVGSANRAPVFPALASVQVIPGSPKSISLNASDPDGDDIQYSLRAAGRMPTTTLAANGQLIISPTLDDFGSYQLLVTAWDGALATNQTINVQVVSDPIETTRISGRVLDVDQTPLVGVQVEIGAVQTLTGSDGSFLLNFGNSSPVSDTLRVRGELLTQGNYPFIAEKLPLLLDHEVYSFKNNVVLRPIYLPKLDIANGKAINPTQDTLVTTSAIPGVSVLVKAGTLMNQQGTLFNGVLSITEVPAAFTPAALPKNLLPDLVVTIQPGEMAFTTPAALSFPNRLEYPAGALFDLWSINPVTGAFDDVGDMRVSADGKSIDTISGGIINSSWHFPVPQLDNATDRRNPLECSCEDTAAFQSTVGLLSGDHFVSHALTGYQSQGQSRGVVLSYDSARAHPSATFQFSYEVVAGQSLTNPATADVRNVIAATVNLKQGNSTIEVAGNSNSQSNQFYWKAENIAIGAQVAAGLVADMSQLPSGIYGYELSTGIMRTRSNSGTASMSALTGRLASVNSINSPFGSGWGVAGVQHLVESDTGAVLLIDGDGSELVFQEDTASGGTSFLSPPSDFSKLEKQLDGTFRRTLTNGMVYEFDANNRLSAVRDRNQNETLYEYDSSGLLQRILDPTRQATTFSYLGGKISSITNPDGRSTHLSIDELGNLARVEAPDGSSHAWDYGGKHLLIGETDPNGNRSSTEYDETSKVIRGTNAIGANLRFQASSGRGVFSASRAASLANPPAADTVYKNSAHMVQPNGRVEKYDLTGGGRILSLGDQLGTRYQVEYNDHELVTRYRNGRGTAFDFAYDNHGNATRTSDSVADADYQSSTLPADGLAFAGRSFDTGAGPHALVMADVNADGLMDAITANIESASVSVLLGGSRGTFQAARHFLVGYGQRHVAVADINADGHLDIVTANYFNDNASVLLGDGAGNFGTARSFAVGSRPTAVAVADFNADGHLDLVTANYLGNNVSVLLNDGSGAFAAPINLPAAYHATSLTISDLNGDDRPDLIVVSDIGPTGVGNMVTVLLGSGAGTFATPQRYNAGNGPFFVTAADVNSDRQTDLVIAESWGDSVLTLLGDGQGAFAEPTRFPAGTGASWVLVTDLNGDGHQDIVSANVQGDSLSVLLGDGQGSFALRSNISVRTPSAVAAVDMDADGNLDLVALDYSGDDVVVFLGNGQGDFANTQLLTADLPPTIVMTADMNDDGRIDMVTVNSDGVEGNDQRDELRILLGDGLGGVALPVVIPTDARHISALALADLNADGHMDIIAGSNSGASAIVFWGDSEGRFSNGFELSLLNVLSLAVADVNADGNLDIVSSGMDFNGDTVAIALGDGLGSFAPVQRYAVGDYPVAVTVADVNSDGNLDIATANFFSDDISLLLADGAGSFAQATSFSVGIRPNSIVVADINRDGKIDLMTANLGDIGSSEPAITLLLGNGLGAFAPATQFAAGVNPRSLVAADLNADGLTDLAVANLADTAIGILRQTGVHDQSETVFGRLADSDVSILLGDGNGDFSSRVEFSIPPGASSLSVADMDNDGRLDLVTAISGISGHAILLSDSRAATIHVRTQLLFDDSFGQIKKMVDGRGNATTNDLDANTGNVQVTHLPHGETIQFSYTSSGKLDRLIDPNGHVTNYDYDGFDRLILVTEAVGSDVEASTRYEYDPTGNLLAIIDGNNHRTEYEYDSLNRRTLVRDPLGNVTRFRYDPVGNLIEVRDALGQITTSQYDAANRLLATTDSLGHITQYTYDTSGNLLSTTDALGNVTRHRYDLRNRRTQTTDPDGGVTSFRYDPDGNMTVLTDPVRNRTLFFYDGRDRLVREVDPLSNEIQYAYDGADNLVQKIDRLSRETRYQYDTLNRLKKEQWIDDTYEASFAYDPAGNLLSVRDEFSSLAYSYDARDRVRTVDNASTPGAPYVVLTYSYDAASNVVSVVDTINSSPGATTSYQYDARNLQTGLTQTGPGLSDKRVDMAYNSLGQFTSIERFAALTRTQAVVNSTFSYDSLNRLKSLKHLRGTSPVAFFDFTYDSASRLTSLSDIDGTTNYGYDKRDQLVSAIHSDTANPDEAYVYDANGNRVSSTLHGNGYVTGQGNRLLSDGQFNYTYDSEGNTLKRTEISTGSVREFQWDFRNRLVAVLDKAANGVLTQSVRFSYDALDRRISKAVDTNPADALDAAIMSFVYDREDVLLDFIDADGAGAALRQLSERYLHGPGIDQVLAQDDANDHVQWHLSDHLGSVHDLVDNDGVLVNHFVYDSFGNVVPEMSVSGATRYLFTGRELDVDIGEYYLRARFFNPQIGNFTIEDPIRFHSGDTNLRRYVLNQPTRSVDPYGHDVTFYTLLGIHPVIEVNTPGGTKFIDFGPRTYYKPVGGPGQVRVLDSYKGFDILIPFYHDELSLADGQTLVDRANELAELAESGDYRYNVFDMFDPRNWRASTSRYRNCQGFVQDLLSER